MGLFSNETKVEVSVELSRAIEDRMIPNTNTTSTVKAILDGGIVSEYLADGWLNSMAYKVNRLYAYAKKEHPYGVPESTLHSALDGDQIVKRVIEQEVGQNVTVGYLHLAPFNALHRAWQILVDQYDYDSRTNQINVLSQEQEAPVYLKDIVPIYSLTTLEDSAPGAQNQWGTPANTGYTPERPGIGIAYAAHTPFDVDTTAEHDIVRVFYTFQVDVIHSIGSLEVPIPEIREGYLDLDLSEFPVTREFYQVQYTKVDSAGPRLFYWSYQVGSETYPEIEATQEEIFTGLGTYLPFTYFRYDFVNETNARHEYSDPFEIQKKMVSYLGMDYNEVGDAINANEGIEDIVHAIMMFGVPPGSEDPVDCKYLYEYFNALWYATGAENPPDDLLWTPGTSSKRFAVHDNRFSLSFGYRAVTKRTVGGEACPVGTYIGKLENKVYYYRYQRTEALYDEIQVDGMLINYKIYNGYSFAGGPGAKSLIVPLDQAFMDRFTAKEREILYARSMHYVMCSYIEYEVKWYSKTWFKVFLIIVAIIITVVTGGAGSGLAAAITTAATATAVAIAIAWWAIQQIVIALISKAIFTMIAKEIGAEAAMILAAVLLVTGVSMQIGGVQGSQALWAENMIWAGNGLMTSSNGVMQQEILSLQDEMTEFNLMAESKWEELEAANNLLGPENLLDPFAFIGLTPITVFGEDPNDFYTRSVHSGNTGALSFDAISSYASTALKLPSFAETIQNPEEEA